MDQTIRNPRRGKRYRSPNSSRSQEELHESLMDTWILHFSKPIEEQVAIDKQRMVPTFETMRLYKLARSGKLTI